MPSNPRDYKKENEYKSKPEQIRLRGIRNKAREAAIKAGKAKVGDGTSVDHIKPLSKGGSEKANNTRLISFAKNSSFQRNADSSVKKNTIGANKKRPTVKKKVVKKKTVGANKKRPVVKKKKVTKK
jgi:hypothetical protein|tara:strand:+ start:134 stop:511 length:378 start_codon:yes stop_codon:yes gene_type:complete